MYKINVNKLIFTLALLCQGILGLCQNSKDWTIKESPIKTTWADSISPINARPEYPRPDLVRNKNWICLNGLWDYAVTDTANSIPDHFGDKILVPFPYESALSGVGKKLLPSQVLWYKRTVRFEKPKNGQKILLHFGAVDWKANVFINGIEVTKHQGGYTNFSCDVTNAMKQGENVIIVKVWDPTDRGIGPHGKQVLNPGNIYYTPSSGIWQTVWMETVPAIYITALKTTPDIDAGVLNIKVDATDVRNVEIIAMIGDREVGRVQGKTDASLILPITNVKLWSPETPFLYDLIVKLKNGDKTIDVVSSYFGMRKIAIQKDEKGIDRIFLNNKAYFNLGTLDQGFWPDGLYTAPTDNALKFDIEAIKAMGFNTIRKHIKVEPARWYYHADKLGILVWQDFVNPNQALPEGAKAEYEKELLETLQQLYNHPSIVSWIVFNERWGQFDQKRLTEYVKKLDPTRIINGHSGELLYVNDQLRMPSQEPYISSDLTDIHSYPFPRKVVKQANKAQVLGEFGGIGVPIEGHLWNDLVAGWGYDGVVSPSILKQQYSLMIDSLKKLKEMGLSGAIYTQPFDVESEQNGLITYDRKIIKLPFSTYYNINSKIVNDERFTNYSNVELRVAEPTTLSFEERYNKLLQLAKMDSSELRTLSIQALNKRSFSIADELSSKYLSIIKDTFCIANLRYMIRFCLGVKSASFKILLENKEMVDGAIGKNAAEVVILSNITKDEIPANLDSLDNIDSKFEDKLFSVYGDLGKEALWKARIVYYWTKKDWGRYGIYYKLYFDRVLNTGRNSFHLNNMSWPIFENVNDTSVLNSAIAVMKYNIENFDKRDAEAFDTYANLLYKIGRTKEALEWELMACQISNNEKIFTETYQKMLRNESTWK